MKSNLVRWHRALTKTPSINRLVGGGGPIKKAYHVGWTPHKELLVRQGLRFLSTQPPQDSIILKPWKTRVVDSNGDYREESYLEEHIGGPLYENQTQLPKLPIPSIEDTLKRFLPTALPLAKTKEEEMSLKAACQAFPEQAALLQERLIDRRENERRDSSWLQPWWNQLGYLQFRDSVVVNVSYFFHFKDDPTVDTTVGSRANIQRAAAMLFATGEFRKLVASGQLPAEKVGKQQTPLCSTAYKYMFHACRIPRPEQDSYRIYDPSRCTHAIVARKGHFFSVEIVDGKSGDPLPLNVLEDQLAQCVDLADSIPSSSRPKLGLLTASNRDNWSDAREQLIRAGGVEMEEALETLESGAMMVNLDDEAPVSRQECGELFLTGGLYSGENRWFDKSIQLLVANNGKGALLGEHSMMDGMPLVNYANYVTNATYADVKKRSSGTSMEVPKVKDIFGSVTEKMDQSLLTDLENKAWVEFKDVIKKQSNTAQSFQGYGSDFIKKSGHSPDAYVQIAVQLATYRLFEEQAATYEATQVRPFLHGRTETTRTVSLDSEAFVKKMGLWPKMDEDDPLIRKEKLDLLLKATAAHAQYTRTAAQAQGVDRHFLGLSMLVEDDDEIPSLFEDPVFTRSKRWRVSTSHLTHPNFVNWGFGQVVPDGVGVAYSILPRSCVFNVTSLEETGWTLKLSDLLEEALLEMQRLTELDQPPVSKL